MKGDKAHNEKNATVPYILKAKRFRRDVSKPCIRNHAVYTVGFCRDPETDPEREAKLDAEFTVSVLDIVKVTAIAASIAAGLAAVVRLIIAACRNDD